MAERVKFTKTLIDSLPLSPHKQIFYRDSVTVGFGLCVGGSKSYFVEKKMPNGQSKRKTIGKHGVYTLDQARAEAKRLLLLIDQGVDPVAEKRKIKHDFIDAKEINTLIPTLSEAFNIYKLKKKLSTNSILAYERCANIYLNDWKDIKLNAITKKMVLDRHAELTIKSPAQANLAVKFLRAVINFTLIKNIDQNGNVLFDFANPVKIIHEQKALNKIKRRKTYIRSEQHYDWALAVVTTEWLGEQNQDFRAHTNQDYIFLLALTGFRRNEGETLLWENVDLKFGTITIKDTKNGEDLTLPMGDVLWHIMRRRKKYAINAYVFADRKGTSHISDRRDARKKITETSGVAFTFHDLRRTFSSVANSLAIGSYTIKRLINHTLEDDDNDVTDGYVQVSFEDMRKAMNMIENVIINQDVKKMIFDQT